MMRASSDPSTSRGLTYVPVGLLETTPDSLAGLDVDGSPFDPGCYLGDTPEAGELMK
jgi:hypothetical protein